jgi:hypothetical protein
MKNKKLTQKRKKKYNKRIGLCHKPETMGKHYKGKSKKHLSEKQKKSLAAGRKVLKHLRTGRQISEAKEPILIKEGYFMSAKKRGRKKGSRRTHGFEGTKQIAFEGKRRRAKHHKAKYLHGAADGFNPANIALDLAGLLAGAIGISFVSSLIPIKSAKIKTFIPLLAGIAGLSFKQVSKNRFMNRAALGMVTIGGYSLTKQFLPQVPLMGATDTAEGIGQAINNLPPEEKAILGILPTQQIEDQTGQEELSSLPGEMLGETSFIEGMPGEMLGEYEPIGAGNDFEE